MKPNASTKGKVNRKRTQRELVFYVEPSSLARSEKDLRTTTEETYEGLLWLFTNIINTTFMKGTERFQQTIQAYLTQRAENDPLFAPNLKKENKSIEECVRYILGEVRKSGCAGFADEEIFSMAVHYFDEDNIKVEETDNAHVVVNHTVELTEEEKAEARKQAIEQYQRMELAKLQTKNSKPKQKVQQVQQPTLFDF